MESSVERGGEGDTVITTAADNVPVCVPEQAPGTVEQQNSKGNYDTIEICITQTKQNAACKLFLRLCARKH
jgi:putative lipoic acid-binding regulatory protein